MITISYVCDGISWKQVCSGLNNYSVEKAERQYWQILLTFFMFEHLRYIMNEVHCAGQPKWHSGWGKVEYFTCSQVSFEPLPHAVHKRTADVDSQQRHLQTQSERQTKVKLGHTIVYEWIQVFDISLNYVCFNHFLTVCLHINHSGVKRLTLLSCHGSWTTLSDNLSLYTNYVSDTVVTPRTSGTTHRPAHLYLSPLMTQRWLDTSGEYVSECQRVVDSFVDWCELNHLQLNISKTKRSWWWISGNPGLLLLLFSLWEKQACANWPPDRLLTIKKGITEDCFSLCWYEGI